MALKYYLPVESLPPRDEGITIKRDLYALNDESEKNSLSQAAVGDIIRGKLTITIPDEYSNVAVEDFVPAGFEIINFNLSTENQLLQEQDNESAEWSGDGENQDMTFSDFSNPQDSSLKDGRKLYPTHTEAHDDRVFLYMDRLEPGVYEYEYYLRALVPGVFQHLPVKAEELYFPEVFGRTSGDIITITKD